MKSDQVISKSRDKVTYLPVVVEVIGLPPQPPILTILEVSLYYLHSRTYYTIIFFQEIRNIFPAVSGLRRMIYLSNARNSQSTLASNW